MSSSAKPEDFAAASDDDSRDAGNAPVSDGSGDEDLDDASKRLRQEVDMFRDELPSADGVEQVEPCQGDAWEHQTAEQRLSAA